jgi:protein involved in polysaccharide export with SLBB domain
MREIVEMEIMYRLNRENVGGRRGSGAWKMALFAVVAVSQVGCVTGIPARRVPRELLGQTRANTVPIDMVRLRQDPPPAHLVEARDILGIYIEGVLGGGEKDAGAPPVQFPERGGLPPSIGYPIPVREDGTISLPLIDPLRVSGKDERGNVVRMTVSDVERLIRKAYTSPKKLLPEGKERIIVTLMRRRSYQVIVVREDATGQPNYNPQITNNNGLMGQQFLLGVSNRGSVYAVDLPAYENDVLHALSQSGGLPGLDAKNEVHIRRGMFAAATNRDELVSQLRAMPPCDPCCPIPPPIPDDPNVTKIPLRLRPGERVNFTQQDIILNNGDVVYIPANPADFFYTGGLLQGGQYQLPRDVDLDVLGAIAIARGPIGNNQITGSGAAGLGNIIPASEVIVIRTTKCGDQIPIRVNLNKALTDKRERLLIQPGDIVLLQYTPAERIGNAILSTVNFNFLFNGFSGGRF